MTNTTTHPQLVEAPVSDAYRSYKTLAYLEAHDGVLNDDYAFVAYLETEQDSGNPILKIKSKGTAGAMFEPAAMRSRCREAGAKAEPYFIWGYSFSPSAGDPRQIEFRVHQQNGAPVALEIFGVTRNADGSAKSPQSVKCDWPGINSLP